MAILFAAGLLPIMLVATSAIDISRMMAARAGLQRAADAAALSGAAIYTAYTQGDTFNALAVSAWRRARSATPP